MSGREGKQPTEAEHYQSEDDFYLDVYLGRAARWAVRFLGFIFGIAVVAGLGAARGWWS